MRELVKIAGDLLYQTVLETMKHVTSADKAYRLIKDWGYYATRSVVRSMWKEVGQDTGWSTLLANLPSDKRPHWSWTIETEKKIGRKYRYTIEYDQIDEEGNVVEKGYLSYLQDTLKPLSDIERDIYEDLDLYAAESEYNFVNPRLFRIETR